MRAQESWLRQRRCRMVRLFGYPRGWISVPCCWRPWRSPFGHKTVQETHNVFER